MPPLQCGAGQLQCGTICADPFTSSAFCGASGDCEGASAGAVCGPNEFCDQGTCAPGCAAGLLSCEGNCVDPQSDEGFCGAIGSCAGEEAGTACAATESCVSGVCTSDCSETELTCGDRCADPQTDAEFCGATGDCTGANAGVACPDGDQCVAGQCETPCLAPSVTCDGTCIDPLTNNTYCGAGGDCTGASAGVTCDEGSDESCQNGTCEVGCVAPNLLCGGDCIDPSTDVAFCGATGDCAGANAGQACASLESCVGGQCSCEAPGLVCDGACVDPDTDANFCGATGDCTGANAGQACASLESCVGGQCNCEAPGLVCDGACVDPDTDANFCGATGDCAGANAGAVCVDPQTCVDGSCGS